MSTVCMKRENQNDFWCKHVHRWNSWMIRLTFWEWENLSINLQMLPHPKEKYRCVCVCVRKSAFTWLCDKGFIFKLTLSSQCLFFSDTPNPLWLWLESLSGAGVPRERAGESTLFHDHHGSSAAGTQRRAHSQEPRDRQIKGDAHTHKHKQVPLQLQGESHRLLYNKYVCLCICRPSSMKKRLCEWRFKRCWISFTPPRIGNSRAAVRKSKNDSLLHSFIHACSFYEIIPLLCLYRDVMEATHISVLRELQEERKVKVCQGKI